MELCAKIFCFVFFREISGYFVDRISPIGEENDPQNHTKEHELTLI